MVIHIIYTPESVKYLAFFAKSLVYYSSYSYRLVANGCSSADLQQLTNLCQENPEQLSLEVIPTETVLTHGQVLNRLAMSNREPYFCFMDSDIFAIAPLPDIEALMNKHSLSAMFSAMPIWVKQGEETMLDDFSEMIGTFNRTERDVCIGSTYFAIYNNEHLKRVMRDFELGFDELFFDQLAAPIRQLLTSMDLNKRLYDTGKLINIALFHQGYKLMNIPLLQLCHIGGTSFTVKTQHRNLSFLVRMRSFIGKLPVTRFLRGRRRDSRALLQKRYTSQEEYHINCEQRLVYRNTVREYFFELFRALSANGKLPRLPGLKNSEIRTKLENGRDHYIRTFKQFNRKANGN